MEDDANVIKRTISEMARDVVRTSAGYKCAQCAKVHFFTMRDSIRCTQCGYRIMYKLRDKNMCIKYTAR